MNRVVIDSIQTETASELNTVHGENRYSHPRLTKHHNNGSKVREENYFHEIQIFKASNFIPRGLKIIFFFREERNNGYE